MTVWRNTRARGDQNHTSCGPSNYEATSSRRPQELAFRMSRPERSARVSPRLITTSFFPASAARFMRRYAEYTCSGHVSTSEVNVCGGGMWRSRHGRRLAKGAGCGARARLEQACFLCLSLSRTGWSSVLRRSPCGLILVSCTKHLESQMRCSRRVERDTPVQARQGNSCA